MLFSKQSYKNLFRPSHYLSINIVMGPRFIITIFYWYNMFL
uniref:Uncharacterized protein n=1 Tax=Rhizophora mucronata TaxID=61149 RepID=A0A2P2NT44_RHIMU